MPALTDPAIRAKPADKNHKLSDTGGLYLFIASTGGNSALADEVPLRRERAASMRCVSFRRA
ncbi:MAG: hypothetical protein LBF50_02085 [Azoarcus sp.]|jgi:hypothetical protein|nr:hypothetical protein [Azoarcus sp.]